MAEKSAIVQRTEKVIDLIRSKEADFRMALPKHIPIEPFMRVAMTLARTNPKLVKCTNMSLLSSLMGAAQLGLSLEPFLGEAYLIPYDEYNKFTRQKEMTCHLQLGYPALIKLTQQGSKVSIFPPQVVHENDEYEFEYGLHPKCKHIPARGKKGSMIAAYSVIQPENADQPYFVWMWRDEIEAIRQRSRAKDNGPWVTDYEAMAKKTVLRQALKWVPKSTELGRALEFDTLADTGISVDSPITIDGEYEVEEEPSKLDQLTETLESETVEAEQEQGEEQEDDEPQANETQDEPAGIAPYLTNFGRGRPGGNYQTAISGLIEKALEDGVDTMTINAVGRAVLDEFGSNINVGDVPSEKREEFKAMFKQRLAPDF